MQGNRFLYNWKLKCSVHIKIVHSLVQYVDVWLFVFGIRNYFMYVNNMSVCFV